MTRGRTRAAAALLVLLTTWLTGSPTAHAVGQTLAPAELGPLVSGTSSVVDGTYVWTDYAYDDTGGSYPNSERNAADLIQLQLSRVPGGVKVRAVLETLTDASVPRLVVGFDTDNNPTTGQSALPGFSWKPSKPLGVDVVSDSFTADTASNTLEGVIPVDPHGATWRAFAAVGLRGNASVFDLAFVGGEAPSGWQDARQQAILTGKADPSDAAASVDFGAHGTHPADIRAPGFHTLLYRSALPLGEGIGQVMIQGPGGVPASLGDLYAGPYQPYVVWVPPSVPSPPPLVTYMHGFTQNHTSNATTLGPGQFDPAAIVVMPLGRGPNSFYLGSAEQDVLDATDDAIARYGADPNRIVLSGISMGGFGTFRLAERYPDRWSGALALIGTGASAQAVFSPVPATVRDQVFSPSRFIGGQAELEPNVADLPFRMVNGQVDPIVNNALVTEDAQRLDALGYDWRYWVLARREHEVVPNLTDCVMDDMVSRHRDADPARVVYDVEPSTFYVDPSQGLDLVYDRAYWVSGLTVRNADEAGAMGTIDVSSLSRADRQRTSGKVNGVGENLTHGEDLCGPNPSVHSQDAWRMQGTTVAPGTPQATSNGLSMTLTRLSGATFDLARASVRTDQPVVLDVTGDGTSTLHLIGQWASSVVVERDGVVVGTVSPSGDALAVAGDFSGHHVVRLVPQSRVSVLGARATAATAGGGSLPETGGAGFGLQLMILALGVASAGVARRLWTRRT